MNKAGLKYRADLADAAPRRRLTALVVLAGALAFSFATRTDASEIILANDSIQPPGAGAPLQTFVPGERVAGWFTSPVQGDLVGVQIYWDSLFGGNPAQQEMLIDIHPGGFFPAPSPAAVTILGPVLVNATPGNVINEFRHADPPTNLQPIQVPLQQGQTFAVSLEFLNQSNPGPFGSGIEIDLDGCQGGTNGVFAVPGGWVDSCLAGVTGDFGIRAIVKPIPEPAGAVVMTVLTGLLLPRRGVRRNRC